MKDDLIRRSDLLPNRVFYVNTENPMTSLDELLSRIANTPSVDAIPIEHIERYLQSVLDKWEALGERKWEPANMWGYNFIMACFDDLAAYGERNGNG